MNDALVLMTHMGDNDDDYNPFGPKSQEIIARIQTRQKCNDNDVFYLTKKGRLIGKSKRNLLPLLDSVIHEKSHV